MIYSIATVGAVYNDGISLVFPGETEASQKHYHCNTSASYSPGDRVKVFYDSGTYIVEYVIGTTGNATSGGSSSSSGSSGSTFNPLSVYPVGSYYWSSSALSPASIFGGTWEQIKGKFLYSVDDGGYAGQTGGEATHTLTIDEIPSHNHTYARSGYNTGSEWIGGSGTSTIVTGNTGNKGGGQAHNNLPPYITAYCWHRTA